MTRAERKTYTHADIGADDVGRKKSTAGVVFAFAGGFVLLAGLVMIGVWGCAALAHESGAHWIGLLGFPVGLALAAAGFFAMGFSASARPSLRASAPALLVGAILLLLPVLAAPFFEYGWGATVEVPVGGRTGNRSATMPFMALAWMCWTAGAVYLVLGFRGLSSILGLRVADLGRIGRPG